MEGGHIIEVGLYTDNISIKDKAQRTVSQSAEYM